MEQQTQPELDDLRSRLKFDYQVVTQMHSPMMEVEAYRNIDDLLAQQNAIDSEEEGYLATHYRVDYRIRTLIERGLYSNKTTVRFDLFANNNYPFSEPGCFVIDSPIPWSPHFLDEHHSICIGPIWEEANGSMLLGELMVHVAKLLNFDEPEYAEPGYGGWNPEAIEYWVTELDRQPLTKNLIYPPLPELVHPVPEPAKQPAGIFVRKKVSGAPSPAIRIRPAGQPQAGASRFRIKSSGTNTR